MPLTVFNGLLVDKSQYKDKSLIIKVLTDNNQIYSGLYKNTKGSDHLDRLDLAQFTCILEPGKDFVRWQKMERSGPGFNGINPRFLEQYYLMVEIVKVLVNQEQADDGFFSFFSEKREYFFGDYHPEFHLYFLVSLLSVLGLHPNLMSEGNYFDLREAVSVKSIPVHADFVSGEEIKPFLHFTNEISVKPYFANARKRRDFLDLILRFISLHRGINFNLKSIQVLRDLRD